MSSTNKALIESLYAAFRTGDVATFFAALDPRVVWTEAENIAYADRNPYVGPEQVGEGVFGRLMADWDAFTVTPEQFVAGDDAVAVTGRYRATYKQTGAPIDAQFVHVWTIRDGRIIRFQQFADTLQFARAMNQVAV